MNSRERQSLDRYITGNYGEDQFKNTEAAANPGPWHVRADYGKENVYRLWAEDYNYFDDTDPETMDANCVLMSAAPDLLNAAWKAIEALNTGSDSDYVTMRIKAKKILADAINKAEGR